MLTVNKVFGNWMLNGGIFEALQTTLVPWQDENIEQALDYEYHGNFSGDKLISPLLYKLIDNTDTITDVNLTILKNTIFALYGKKWSKLWDTLNFEYNPIQNYDMIENMLDDEKVTEYGKTHTRTDNTTHSKTGTETETPSITETRTDNLTLTTNKDVTVSPDTTETTTPNLTRNTDNIIHGFNSSTGVPSGSETATDTGTNTVRKTGDETTEHRETNINTGTQQNSKTGTDQMVYNTQEKDTGTVQDADTGLDTETRNYTLTRSGNIGVTTSQQMITQERELQMWNYFHTVVFPDLDRVLTIPIY